MLDYSRTITILFVILVHATENLYPMKADVLMTMSGPSPLICSYSFYIGEDGGTIVSFPDGIFASLIGAMIYLESIVFGGKTG